MYQQQPVKTHGAMLGWGIASLVGGVVVGGIGMVLLVFPLFIFLLGGGGNTEAFDDTFGGVITAGWVGALLGLALVVLGIVLLVTRARRRKQERQQHFA